MVTLLRTRAWGLRVHITKMNQKNKILISISFLTFLFLGLIVVEIFIIRQIIAFAFLTFVPGFLLLWLLRKKIGHLEDILYSIGLSLSLLMLIGFLMNIIYPYFGISKPISEIPLMITISIVVFILLVGCHFRSEDISISLHNNLEEIPLMLSLTLLPFISIFGAVLFNQYNTNILLLFLFAIISIIPLLMISRKTSKRVYPLIIWLLSISILLHNSLINTNLAGGDAILEFYMANLVKIKEVWNPSLPINTNAMLAIVMLHPIYSIIENMNLIHVFKIIYPLLFSITPVILYQAFKRITTEDFAFLSSCFFMFIHTFIYTLTRNTRTGIAILFLAFLLLLIVDKRIGIQNRGILAILFTFSLVNSHYATSYIYLFIIIPISISLILFNKFWNIKIKPVSSPSFSALFGVICIGWYIYVSPKPFISLVKIGSHIVNSLSDFGNIESTYVLAKIYSFQSPSIKILSYLYYSSLVFILIGFFISFKSILKEKSNLIEYYIHSFFFLMVVFASLMPKVTGWLGPDRIYAIVLVFLAPFFGIGLDKIISAVKYITKIKLDKKISSKIFAVFLSMLFLFNSGFMSITLLDDISPYPLINKQKILESGSNLEIFRLFRQYNSEYALTSSKWLTTNYGEDEKLYVSGKPFEFKAELFSQEFKGRYPHKFNLIEPNIIEQEEGGYIYLGEVDLRTGMINIELKYGSVFFESIPLMRIEDLNLNSINRIYANGLSTIYKFRARW